MAAVASTPVPRARMMKAAASLALGAARLSSRQTRSATAADTVAPPPK